MFTTVLNRQAITHDTEIEKDETIHLSVLCGLQCWLRHRLKVIGDQW